MPKMRGIKPEFWTDDKLVEVSPLARLLFIGMWTYACDNGHVENKPKQLKMRILPADECDVHDLIVELIDVGCVFDRGDFLDIPNLPTHQRIDRRYFTTCDHCGTDATTEGTRRGHDGDTSGARGNTRGPALKEGRKEGEGDGEKSAAGKPAKRATQLPPDFRPSEKHVALAAEEGVDLRAEWPKFCDHHRAKGSTFKDWSAALNNWIRNAAKFSGNVRPLRTELDEHGQRTLPPLPKGGVRAVTSDLRQAELALLAAVIESKTARTEARKHLTGRDLDDPRHEEIWDATVSLDRHGRPVDHVTVNAALTGRVDAQRALVDVVTTIAIPDNVATYASIVRGAAVRRELARTARAVLQDVETTTGNPGALASRIVTQFTQIRDSGHTAEDATALTVTELLAQDDDQPDWLIPGLLERRDRFMLTGEEGLGKSHLLRQFAIHAAGGINPLDQARRFTPLRTILIDCENTWGQVRRKIRPAVEWVSRNAQDPSDQMMVDCLPRIDIRRDRDLARIHQLLDALQPDLVVIGPLYRLVPVAIQSDDEAAPVLAALDTIRERGCALLMEAHAGHSIGKGGVRDLRPRGSSALLGWPEFGYGLRNIGATGYADLVQWRGPREERAWPARLRHARDGSRWLPHIDANTDVPTAWGA